METQHKFGLPLGAYTRIVRVLNNYPGMQQVLIYGSRSMGNHKHGSDIDLVITGESFTLDQLLELSNELDDLLLPYSIDLARLAQISDQKLLTHIAEHGQCFWSYEE